MQTGNLVSIANVTLMFLSAAVAYYIPCELLLFSYAILGPAHYLTEISWLHDRKYFATGDKDYLLMVVLCFLSLFAPASAGNTLILIAFAAAAVMAFTKDVSVKKVSVLALFLTVLVLRKLFGFGDQFSILLATIIHVYLFTGAFILLGALKRKNGFDILSLVVFVGCALCFFVFPPNAANYRIGEEITKNITFFASANSAFLDLVHLENNWQNVVSAMGFFAFAYTYHYLNWFSKTNIIRWHEVSRDRLVTIATLYVISIGAYSINYALGLSLLLFLSLLHVLLEFPLNHRTFVEISKELSKLTAPA